ICIQPQSGVIKDVAVHQGRTPVHNPAFFGTEPVVRFLVGIANIRTIYEARHGDKARADVVVDGVVSKVQTVAFEFELVRRTGIVIRAELARTYDGLTFQGRVGIELKAGVDSADAVELVGRGIFPVGINHAPARLLEDVAARAHNREVGARARERITIRNTQARTAVVG